MKVRFYGVNCFLVKTKELDVLFSPFNDNFGLKLPKNPDVVLYTQDKEATQEAPKEAFSEAFIVDTPGEYEIEGLMIRGVGVLAHGQEEGPPQSIGYALRYNNVNLLLLGNIDGKIGDEQIEAFGDVHVMSVPVGGGGTLNKEAAAEVVSFFDPGVVVPSHYQDGDTKYEEDQDGVEVFLDEYGVEDKEEEDELKLSFSGLPDETQIVVLKRRG